MPSKKRKFIEGMLNSVRLSLETAHLAMEYLPTMPTCCCCTQTAHNNASKLAVCRSSSKSIRIRFELHQLPTGLYGGPRHSSVLLTVQV